jgi:hypothetical protein
MRIRITLMKIRIQLLSLMRILICNPDIRKIIIFSPDKSSFALLILGMLFGVVSVFVSNDELTATYFENVIELPAF